MKAFLGMGLLGSNFVKAMVKRGEGVQIWNRTHSKAAELKKMGAKPFRKVEDAVRDADMIHLTLKDDESVKKVLKKAKPALKPGVIIIDHTTTSVTGAKERTEKWKKLGYTYLHAPVFMGPANALESSGFMLVSGDQAVIAGLEKELSLMTGKLLNFGPEPGKAAAMKLIGNAFLVTLTAGIGDTLALAKALKVEVEAVNTLFGSWNPGAAVSGRIKRITQDDLSKPSWELNMARKDTGLFMDAAEKADISLAVIPAIAKLMDRWIKKGHGSEDWAVIGKSY